MSTASLGAVAGCSSTCPDDSPPEPDVSVDLDTDPPGELASMPSTDWPSPYFDSGNTGFAPEATVPAEDISLGWRTSVPNVASAPVVADGAVFLWADERLRAHEVRTGERRWDTRDVVPSPLDTSGPDSRSLSGQVVPPAADGDSLYVAGENRVAALDTDDGAVQWEYTDSSAFGPPTVHEGRVYVTAETGLLCLDRTDGTEQWRWGAPVEKRLLAAGEQTVAYAHNSGDTETSLWVFETANGEQRWERTLSATYQGDYRPVITDGTLYRGGDETLHAFDLATGERRWAFTREGASEYSSPVVTDDTFYVVEEAVEASNATFALGRRDGEPAARWCSESIRSTAVGADGDHLLAVGEYAHGMTAYEAALGNAPWEASQQRTVLNPAILDGVVIAATEDGRLFALEGRP
jgi:hypothetical protein